jgi:SAM-dependent methyltransferase
MLAAMSADVWSRNAAQWSAVGLPLKPSDEDLVLYEAALGPRLAAPGGAVLVLGVTPALCRTVVAMGARVTAVDRSAAMIGAGFPEGGAPGVRVLEGDWRALPLEAGAFAAAVGDGALAALGTAARCGEALAEVRRVLGAGAPLVLRCYVRPDTPEPVEAVFGDLLAGAIPSFHAFKWRLAQALPQDGASGVRLGDVFAAWEARGVDRDQLAAERGWDVREVATIDAYRGLAETYLFPTRADLGALTAPFFEEGAVRVPGYTLGERCPVITYHAR